MVLYLVTQDSDIREWLIQRDEITRSLKWVVRRKGTALIQTERLFVDNLFGQCGQHESKWPRIRLKVDGFDSFDSFKWTVSKC